MHDFHTMHATSQSKKYCNDPWYMVDKQVNFRRIKHEETADDVVVRNLAGLLKLKIILRRQSGQNRK